MNEESGSKLKTTRTRSTVHQSPIVDNNLIGCQDQPIRRITNPKKRTDRRFPQHFPRVKEENFTSTDL